MIPKYDQVDFLFHYFELQKDWLINTYTQGGQPNLSGDIIKSIELLIPALEEQTAYLPLSSQTWTPKFPHSNSNSIKPEISSKE